MKMTKSIYDDESYQAISAANTLEEGDEDREQSSHAEDERGDVLAADTSILKPEAELRRIFGQRALRNEIDRGGGTTSHMDISLVHFPV